MLRTLMKSGVQGNSNPSQLQGRPLEISRRRERWGGGGGGKAFSKPGVVICEAKPEWGYYMGYKQKTYVGEIWMYVSSGATQY